MASPFRAGRRWFSVAGVLMMLTGLAHGAGHFSSLTPPDEASAALYRTLEEFKIPMGAMIPSMRDVMEATSLTMSVTLLALGVLSLIVAGARESSHQLIRRMAIVNLLWVLVLCAVYYGYRIPPPLIFTALIAIATFVQLLSARRVTMQP